MIEDQLMLSQVDALFKPESIAVIGVPRGMKSGKLFLMALFDQEYKGPIYPVHPSADEIDGLKAYPNVTSIPGPVDLAIVLVPTSQTMGVVKECAAKGVKGAVLFTAGYKETGTAEGKAAEEEMTRIAREAGMRLIGPNCMGLYAPGTGLAFFPDLSKVPGPVGLISHSGSLANILGRVGPEKGITFSKAISLGNECDLVASDFMLYLGHDSQTKVIGAYLENIKPGSNFLERLKKTSLSKPVIIWKVGLTAEGSRAAASHTGALRGSSRVWQGIVKQAGATPVVGFEAWMDALMGFSMLKQPLGDRIAVLSGPGGLAVSAAEAIGRNNLKLADLSDDTTARLATVVPPTGTSLKNPIDVGLSASLEIDIYIKSARMIAEDDGVDAIIAIGGGLSPETNQQYIEAVIATRKKYNKPFLMIGMPGRTPEFADAFFKADIPFFESSERALKTYADVKKYQDWKRINTPA